MTTNRTMMPDPPCPMEIESEFRRGFVDDLKHLEFCLFDNKRRAEFSFEGSRHRGMISAMLKPVKEEYGYGMWERAALAIARDLGDAAAHGKSGLQLP